MEIRKTAPLRLWEKFPEKCSGAVLQMKYFRVLNFTEINLQT